MTLTAPQLRVLRLLRDGASACDLDQRTIHALEKKKLIEPNGQLTALGREAAGDG